VTTRDHLSGEAERVKEQLADTSLKNKQLYKSYISYKEAYRQASAHLEAINQTDGKVALIDQIREEIRHAHLEPATVH
jgi:hypothetical protein